MAQTPQYPHNASPSDAVMVQVTDPGNTSSGTQPLGTTEYSTIDRRGRGEDRVTCRCGCPRIMHRHLHRRTYCGHCETCNRYRPSRWWQRRKP